MFWKMLNLFVQIWIAFRLTVVFIVRLLLFLLLIYYPFKLISPVNLFPEVETNEIFPPKALITNGSMMSNLENRCGDFCYKDEKYHLPAGTVILNSNFLILLLLEYVRKKKMIIGAIKNDQRWRVFSSLCPIPVRVIWLSSVVNRVSRYYHLSLEFCFLDI